MEGAKYSREAPMKQYNLFPQLVCVFICAVSLDKNGNFTHYAHGMAMRLFVCMMTATARSNAIREIFSSSTLAVSALPCSSSQRQLSALRGRQMRDANSTPSCCA